MRKNSGIFFWEETTEEVSKKVEELKISTGKDVVLAMSGLRYNGFNIPGKLHLDSYKDTIFKVNLIVNRRMSLV